MGELVRKRGRPVSDRGKRRRLEIRISDREYDMLVELVRIKGKTFTDILVEGLEKQHDELYHDHYGYFDDYNFDGFDGDYE